MVKDPTERTSERGIRPQAEAVHEEENFARLEGQSREGAVEEEGRCVADRSW